MVDRSPKDLSTEEVLKHWEENGRVIAKTASHFGVHPSSISRHLAKVRSKAPSTNAQIAGQKDYIKQLELALADEQRLRDSLFQIANVTPNVPEWVLKVPKGEVSHLTGVPTLFCSDWHWSEVVRPSEIGGVNEYNMTIAHRRCRNLTAVTIELLTKHLSNPNYPGLVLALGGDMLSGDIHDELVETNEVESFPALLDLLGTCIWMIDALAEAFTNIFIVGVTGNHGRMTRKPRAKRRNHTNMDWLLYNLLQKHYAANSNLTFHIAEGSDASYRIYNHRYLLTHGDQFRGGDGMIGMLGPVTRGDHKKRTRQMQVGQSYDTMLMGHWHQWTPMSRTIVNGSLKGYDEYAYQSNFPFETPKQGLWLTHPEHGITFTMPVLVDRASIQEQTEWVSVPRAESS